MRCPRNAPRCDGPDGKRPKCAVCSEDKIKALILDLGKVVNERDAANRQIGELEDQRKEKQEERLRFIKELTELKRLNQELQNKADKYKKALSFLLARVQKEEGCLHEFETCTAGYYPPEKCATCGAQNALGYGFAEKRVVSGQTEARPQRSVELCQPVEKRSDEVVRPKSIAELEYILNRPEPSNIQINPDGSVSKRSEVCDSCGWNNDANHGGGSRKMYTMGKVTKCGECLPTTR